MSTDRSQANARALERIVAVNPHWMGVRPAKEAIGLPDRAVVSMRFSRVELDPSDERPLQSRRSYLLGRWAAVVHMRDGRVVRVEEHPHLEAALEAAGLEAE